MSTDASQKSPEAGAQDPPGAASPVAASPPEAAAATAPTTVRLEGLAEALQQARSALDFVGPAGRFHVANLRMVLLRNALIVLAIVAAAVLLGVVGVREASRPTLTIAAFDVPPSLQARGLSGQVLAKALFDELIRRRELVTTLDAGELKGTWAENRVDVAIPQAGFTLQSVFRYLRYATGNETSIDGEVVLDGDNATLKVRVAGKPPTVVQGPLAEWDRLVGALAGGVLEATHPAVHAAWLGQKAQTPAELAALSRHLRAMQRAHPPHSNAVMSVAYDAYGSALKLQGRTDDAMAAFGEAIALDPTNGSAVVNMASAKFGLREFEEAERLYAQAQAMRLPDFVKLSALRSRIHGAIDIGDCDAARQALRDAKASPLYEPWRFINSEATFIHQCDHEEARAVAMVARAYALHPEDAAYANTLSKLNYERPEGRYREQGFKVSREAIAAGIASGAIYENFRAALLEAGRFDEAAEVLAKEERLFRDPAQLELWRKGVAGWVHLNRREFAKAEEAWEASFAKLPPREQGEFSDWARVQIGLGRFDRALAIYRDGLQRLPRNCRLWQELGSAQAARGRPEDITAALATFDQGIAAVPKCGLSYNAAARLLIAQGRPAEARARLETLIRQAPNSDGAVIAKELLASLPAKP
ncbi:tetratricopeptide repeat protein [Rubrivivax rivuli]|uniref:Tetratricopeptide repeat protein n=1 Tax=Rubrivivax rivuli TaxID=1862385 RepID=A0A437RAK9_9BURK|nr:tetratricopeptide repeat protein [Rubrivivax rivuli]RVU43809.1 tetratricopeptide repeat protein [Rubrivivax rivuli]